MLRATLMLEAELNEVEPIRDDLDYLLDLWHRWSLTDRGVRGWNRKALVLGDIPEKRGLQYESQLEAQDIRADNLKCKAVDYAVREMDEPWRSAIYCLARNLSTGRAVWSSPRLPKGEWAREIIVEEARAMLRRRLESAGVL